MRLAAIVIAILGVLVFLTTGALLAIGYRAGVVEIHGMEIWVYWSDPEPGRLGVAPPAHYFTIPVTQLLMTSCLLLALPSILITERIVQGNRRQDA